MTCSDLRRGTIFKIGQDYYKVTSISSRDIFAENLMTRKQESFKKNKLNELLAAEKAKQKTAREGWYARQASQDS